MAVIIHVQVQTRGRRRRQQPSRWGVGAGRKGWIKGFSLGRLRWRRVRHRDANGERLSVGSTPGDEGRIRAVGVKSSGGRRGHVIGVGLVNEALAAGRLLVQREDGCAQLRRSQRWRGRQPGDEGPRQDATGASPMRVPINGRGRRSRRSHRRRCRRRHIHILVYLVVDPLNPLFIIHRAKVWLVLSLQQQVVSGGGWCSGVTPRSWSKPSVSRLHTIACNDKQGKDG